MKKALVRGASVTAFVFGMMWAFSGLADLKIFSEFDPFSQALKEFELTDLVFSKFRDQPDMDERIVIVNIGQQSRLGIGQMIQILSQYKPKVIGVDSFFNCEGGLTDSINCPQVYDTLSNLVLANAIQEAGNVVLVEKLLQSDSLANVNPGDVYDSIEYSDPVFSAYTRNAFANLPTGDREGQNAATHQEDAKICKELIPSMMVNGKRELAFSVMMAWMYDSVKTQKFLDRNNEVEIINFKGNIDIDNEKLVNVRENMNQTSNFRLLCYALDWHQVMSENFDPQMIEGKIVLMGYLGDQFGDPSWEDKFFTPLNAKVAGRANPDMYGPVIHANSVSMILSEAYIDEISTEVQVLIAIIACFLNVLLFYWIDEKFPAVFDGLSVVLQLFQIFLVGLVTIQVFNIFNLKLELSLTMIALALIGPGFDMWKSIENSIIVPLTTRKRAVLTAEKQ